jgi:hypothetical protein
MDSLVGLAVGLSTAAGLRVFDEGFGVGTLSTLRWALRSDARPGDGWQIGSEVLVPRMGKAYRPWVHRHPQQRPLGLGPFQWQRIRNVRAGQDPVTVHARCV